MTVTTLLSYSPKRREPRADGGYLRAVRPDPRALRAYRGRPGGHVREIHAAGAVGRISVLAFAFQVCMVQWQQCRKVDDLGRCGVAGKYPAVSAVAVACLSKA